LSPHYDHRFRSRFVNLNLKHKNIIVTGGSKGIGRAIALAFADEGANVAICARGMAALDSTRDEVAAKGVKCFAAACDVGDASALAQFLEAANAALGGVDVLVNNPSGFGMTDDEAGWKSGFDVDMMAAVRSTQTVTPWIAARGGGAIIHISSISGMEGTTRSIPYAAMKAAMISHSKSMALTLAPKNIRVNCVCPGSVEFPGGSWDQRKLANDPLYEAIRNGIPSKRLGRPEEIAAVVVFLASAQASWLTGANIPVDGGQHRGNF
jgi:3-oxoacyl-[acyl-carrier protein] reductase